MPLVRRMARTAVVAGTATAVSGRVGRRQDQKWAAKDEQQAAAAQPAAPAAPPEDPMEALQKLGALHEQGILTDEEFAAEKAKVLNG